MILALSRGFVVQEFGNFVSFTALHALADDGDDGGSGGGDAGDGGSGGGDAGDGGSGGGDAGDGSSGGGDAGDGTSGGGDAGTAGGAGGGDAPADVIGCMDPSADNYNPSATDQTGITCTYPAPAVYGCMDSSATNYNPSATDQTGVTCIYPILGCMDSSADNYNPSATDQTGITCTYPILGCMDSSATNYNPSATDQTGITCTYPPPPPGPTCVLSANPDAIQIGNSATLSWTTANAIAFSIDNGIGFVTPAASGSNSVSPSTTVTYTGTATGASGSVTCSATITVTPIPIIYGCMDSSATNYNPSATSQTGVTCTYPAPIVYGCMDSTATNYNPSATSQTGVTCTYPAPIIYGCMDSTATNYNPSATSQTGVTCTYPVIPPAPIFGCMDSTATNYNPSATSQSGVTCTYPPLPATIRVNKVVINDDGGTKVIADFPLLVNTTAVVNGVVNTFSPGSYTVSETNQPGYAASFSGDCDAAGTITISAGQNKVCTITNNDIAIPPVPATIKVNKVVINDDGGTKVIADFPLLVDTTAVVSGAINTFSPGTYTVTETNQPGYASTFSGDCNSSGTITISAGQNKVCTITNNDIAVPPVPATIQVIKVVTNDDGGTKVIADFPLFVSTATATTSVVSSAVNTFSPGTYTVSETNQPGYAASFSGDCDAAGTITITAGQNKVCTLTNNDIAVVVTPPSGGGGSHGSGGGVRRSSTITLAPVPSQPLAYLYLSQIPYTGLDLGPIGTVLYWIALIGWSLALAYLVLFGAVPVAKRRMSNFGYRVSEALNVREFAPVVAQRSAPAPESQLFQNNVMTPEPPRSYSSYDGFKSYAKNGALSVDDIVKGLSRHQHAVAEHTAHVQTNVEPIYEKVEPVFEHVEPIYENVETIVSNATVESGAVQPHIRGFAAALVEGDRVAVFAGLRQHLRGGGVPEHLLSKTVCLIDDVYRSRIDGTVCDPDMARMTARLNTPTLEKLVASLATAIDSSYSTGVTGAKLALTRALSVLGA
ncbi:MAG: hypothetical protein Q7R90_00090 [bacterium]|nr:hypothetical protein [bacterium]